MTGAVKAENIKNLDNPQIYTKALFSIVAFKYRERFHLSYQQFMEEPVSEFITNNKIIDIINQIDEANRIMNNR